jgi:hypothetical protein
MRAGFWVNRFLIALLVACAILFLVGLIKGRALENAAQSAALWGVLSAGIFTLAGYIRYKRNPACMLPRQK